MDTVVEWQGWNMPLLTNLGGGNFHLSKNNNNIWSLVKITHFYQKSGLLAWNIHIEDQCQKWGKIYSSCLTLLLQVFVR